LVAGSLSVSVAAGSSEFKVVSSSLIAVGTASDDIAMASEVTLIAPSGSVEEDGPWLMSEAV
jgi:hypothetical protein